MTALGRWTATLLATMAFVGVSVGSTNATPTSGTFDVSGNFTGSASGITWQNSLPPFTADQATIGNTTTGGFAGLTGNTVTIDNISFSTEAVGSAFAATSFLSGISTLPDLELTNILAGVNGAMGCAATPPAALQECTPATPAGFSLYNFQNTPGGGSSLSFDLIGTTSDGLSSWTGIFTSQFTEPYQTVLAGGSFNNSYSATFIVTPNATTGVPEPFTLSLFGAGLVGAAAMRRRKTGTAA